MSASPNPRSPSEKSFFSNLTEEQILMIRLMGGPKPAVYHDVAFVVRELGGWGAVIKAWRTEGGKPEAFAEVWELMLWLQRDAAGFAGILDASEEEVRAFSRQIAELCMNGSYHHAEAVLEEFCRDLATGFGMLGADHGDIEAVEMAAYWTDLADRFARGVLREGRPK